MYVSIPGLDHHQQANQAKEYIWSLMTLAIPTTVDHNNSPSGSSCWEKKHLVAIAQRSEALQNVRILDSSSPEHIQSNTTKIRTRERPERGNAGVFRATLSIVGSTTKFSSSTSILEAEDMTTVELHGHVYFSVTR